MPAPDLWPHGAVDAMAASVVVPAYRIHALPDEVYLDQAAALELAAVALHSIRMSGLRPGDTCAVFGMGPVGLLAVALLRLCGAGELVLVGLMGKAQVGRLSR